MYITYLLHFRINDTPMFSFEIESRLVFSGCPPTPKIRSTRALPSFVIHNVSQFKNGIKKCISIVIFGK